jgi:hypothetical protein
MGNLGPDHLTRGLPVRYVSSSPDGVLTAQRGTLAIDTTTGVTWRNASGGTDWWPEIIPTRAGSRFFTDFVGSTNLPFSGNFAVGGAAIALVEPPATRWGVVRFTVTALNDAQALRAPSAQGTLVGGGAYYFETALTVGQAEDGTNRRAIRVGLNDGNGTPADAVFFESSLAGNGSVNWYRCAASNSVVTRTDTGIAIAAAGTYQRLRWRINSAGTQVDYWIDDVSAGSVTTNIPTGAGRATSPMLEVDKTLGAGAVTVDFDYYDLAVVFAALR